MKTRRHHNKSGVALILALTILAVVLILLMAFITSMRTERMAAKASTDLSRAQAMAEGAVDEAVGLLQASMTNITSNTSYITAPGVVYTRNGTTWTETPLFTPTAGVSFSNSVLGSYAPGTPIQVGWQKVFSPSPNVKIVGRFAYWVDDESTKVNINTAKSRLSDPSGYTPAAIDLAQIFPSDAANIITYLSGGSGRPFDSIESLKLGPPSVPTAPDLNPTTFSNSEFFVTANATSPDLTPWGTKRVNIIAIATNTTLLTDQKIVAITNAFNDANCLAWYGKAFSAKYASLAQIAANIIDYIDTDTNCTDSGTGPLDLNPPTYLGLEQTPYLNELSIQTGVGATGPDGSGNFTLNFTTIDNIELSYPYTAGGWALPLGANEVVLLNRPTITVTPTPPGTVNGQPSVTLSFPPTVTLPITLPMVANSYRTFPPKSEVLTPSVGTMPLTMTTKDAIIVLNSGTVTAIFRNQTLGRFDYAMMPVGSYTNNYDATAAAPNYLWASACNDPRVKPISNNWTATNVTTLGTVNTGIFDQSVISNGVAGDGDSSCHGISGVGIRDRGTMYPSELAFIHTGHPWRTFWLEPQPTAESGNVPDWLAVDLFSTTDSNSVPGRININLLDGNSATPARLLPLSALLSGNPSIATATGNIYSVTLQNAPTVPAFAWSSSGARNAFTTAGQVCEVQNLAATGTKAARELPIQEIVNLVTPRSDTFTIWAIAQTIQKGDSHIPLNFDPANDHISGEVQIQAIVQRYEDASTSPATVRFRTLYYRYIYQ